MQILRETDGDALEQAKQIIDGLNDKQVVLLTEQALEEPEVVEIRITRQARRRIARAERKAQRRKQR